MSVKLFSEGGAVFYPDAATDVAPYSAHCVVHMNGEVLDMCLVNMSTGKQAARLQVDATLDGSMYAIGCDGGVGSYNMVFYDGLKTTDCDDTTSSGFSDDSVMKKYLALKNIKDRHTEIYLYPPSNAGVASSTCCGVFKGLVNAIDTTIKEEEGGNVALYVGLSVIGGWRQV